MPSHLIQAFKQEGKRHESKTTRGTRTAAAGTTATRAGTGTKAKTAAAGTAAIRIGAGTETKKAATRSAVEETVKAVVTLTFIHQGGVMDRPATAAKL
jgi:hypothetical protein